MKSDKCDRCDKDAEYGVTGLKDGSVRHESFCGQCYRVRNIQDQPKPKKKVGNTKK